MEISNYFTFWQIVGLFVRICTITFICFFMIYLSATGMGIFAVGLCLMLHSFFLIIVHFCMIHIVQIHKKSPTCNIVMFSHEIRLDVLAGETSEKQEIYIFHLLSFSQVCFPI